MPENANLGFGYKVCYHLFSIIGLVEIQNSAIVFAFGNVHQAIFAYFLSIWMLVNANSEWAIWVSLKCFMNFAGMGKLLAGRRYEHYG